MIDFSTPFQDFNYSLFLQDFLPEELVLQKEDLVKQGYQKYITEGHILGTVKSLNLSILEFRQSSEHDPRVSLAKEAFRIMADHRIRRGLVIFWNPQTRNWRLSLMTISLDIDEKNNIVRNYSNAKRFSFLLGEGEAMKTPRTQLSTKVKDFEDLQKRFSVEVVRKEFFDDYIDLFIRLYIEISKDESFIRVLSEQGIDKVKFAKNLLGKIIFVYFVQKKGWLGLDRDGKWGQGDKNFMRSLWNRFARDDTFVKPSTEFFYNDYLEHLFYNGFNKDRRDDDGYEPNMKMKVPYLNGGLFKEDYRDWEHFIAKISNDIFSNGINGILDTFDTYNFTIDEDDLTDAEIAVDPEMLGKIFEKMIAIDNENIDKVIKIYNTKREKKKLGRMKMDIENWEVGENNKKLGAFYTPREIVHYMTRESLIAYLSTNISGKKEENELKIRRLIDAKDQHLSRTETIQVFGNNTEVLSAFTQETDAYLQKVKIIDPAVGSGAFPMGILHEITTLRYYLHSEGFCTVHHNDTEEGTEELTDGGKVSMYQIKRETIKNSIYGVDIDPGAIDIARLRFWLSLVVDAEHPEPLPNFEFNFVCANTLLPLFEEDIGNQTQLSVDDSLRVERLREFMKRFYNADTRKEKEDIQSGFRNYINKKYRIDDHKQLALEGSFTPRQRQIIEFNPFNNNHSNPFFDPSLMMSVFRGFDIAIGNPPYIQLQKFKGNPIQQVYKNVGYETHDANGDIYCLFYELGIRFLKSGGHLTYITSNKWMRAAYGEKLRIYFSHKNPRILIDLGPDIFETATVDSNIFMIQNTSPQKKNLRAMKLTASEIDAIEEKLNEKAITLTELGNGPWFIGSSAQLALKKKIESLGTPLKDWSVKINYGIKTGLNEAFIIDRSIRDKIIAEDPKNSDIIKPILRGRDIKRYVYAFEELYLLQTGFDLDIPNLYPAIYNHLLQFEESARNRDDQGRNWWNLRACIYYNEFENEKIVWQEMSREPTFSYDNQGVFCNDTGRILTGEKIKFFVGFFNSNFFKFTFANYYSGGGLGEKGIRYKSEFMKEFPIPSINSSNQKIVSQIECIVDQIIEAKKLDSKTDTSDFEKQIDELVHELYELTEEEIKIIESK